MSQRHILFCLIRSITNHESLVSSSDFLFVFVDMDWVGNLGRLLINCNDNGSHLMVHSDVYVVITNFFNSLSCNLFEIDFSSCTDLAEDHTDRILNGRLTSNFGIGILRKTSVQDGVGYIVTKLIGVTACDVFRGKEKVSRLREKIHNKSTTNKIKYIYEIILFY